MSRNQNRHGTVSADASRRGTFHGVIVSSKVHEEKTWFWFRILNVFLPSNEGSLSLGVGVLGGTLCFCSFALFVFCFSTRCHVHGGHALLHIHLTSGSVYIVSSALWYSLVRLRFCVSFFSIFLFWLLSFSFVYFSHFQCAGVSLLGLAYRVRRYVIPLSNPLPFPRILYLSIKNMKNQHGHTVCRMLTG